MIKARHIYGLESKLVEPTWLNRAKIVEPKYIPGIYYQSGHEGTRRGSSS